MKGLYECAVVRDGNKRVGSFVCQLNGADLHQSLSLAWNFVDEAIMESYIKGN